MTCDSDPRPFARALFLFGQHHQALHPPHSQSDTLGCVKWLYFVPWPYVQTHLFGNFIGVSYVVWSGLKLRSMLLHMGAYGIVDRASGPPGYQAALSRAFNDFTAWRKSMRIASSQKRFNYYGLFKEEFGTFLNCKGYNARVVSEWLMEVLNRVALRDWPLEPRTLNGHNIQYYDDRLHLCRTALNHDCTPWSI